MTVPGRTCGLNKKGTGTFTLWGDALYTGSTTVSNGTLAVNGYVAGPVRVGSPSGTVPVLGGLGTIAGNVPAARGRIAPGSSVGIQRTGNLSLDSASTLAIEINTNGVAGTDYDQVKVTGTVNLNSDSGVGSALAITLGYAPKVGEKFTIIDNDGADGVNGTFGSGVDATYAGRTYHFIVNTQGGDGNDVVLERGPSGTTITIR